MYKLPCLTRTFWLGACWAAALMPWAHIAHADDAKHKIAEFLDLDGDKRISYEEFVHSMAVQAIRDMDSDKDGHLSAAEAKQSAAPENTSIPALDFHAIDLNGDGKISLDELKQALGANADVEAIFRRLDIDGDGFLSEAELQGSHGTPQIRFRF